MQQQSSRHGSRGDPEVDALLAGMERLLLRLADVGPRDRVVVPVVLPLEVAELLLEQTQPHGGDLEDVYVECLLHGRYHGAVEHGQHDLARRIAAMTRRTSAPGAWARFAQQHPEAKEGV